MAQNLERIMQVLTSHAEGMCDDCLSRISGVTPRQTVYAICSAQSQTGVISRAKRVCPQDGCRRTKLVNALQVNRLGDRIDPPTAPPDPGGTRKEQTEVLSNLLHEMSQMLRAIDNSAPSREPFAAWVTRLRKTEILPKKIAAMMLTINVMRVEVVKDRTVLPADEWAAVEAIWKVLDRWKKGLLL